MQIGEVADRRVYDAQLLLGADERRNDRVRLIRADAADFARRGTDKQVRRRKSHG
jgi:hypothetical protein